MAKRSRVSADSARSCFESDSVHSSVECSADKLITAPSTVPGVGGDDDDGARQDTSQFEASQRAMELFECLSAAKSSAHRGHRAQYDALLKALIHGAQDAGVKSVLNQARAMRLCTPTVASSVGATQQRNCNCKASQITVPLLSLIFQYLQDVERLTCVEFVCRRWLNISTQGCGWRSWSCSPELLRRLHMRLRNVGDYMRVLAWSERLFACEALTLPGQSPCVWKSLDWLRGMPVLRHLRLDVQWVKPGMFETVADCAPRLQSLYLEGSNPALSRCEKAFDFLTRLQHLSVFMPPNDVCEDQLQVLENVPSLRELIASQCSKLRGLFLQWLPSGIRQIGVGEAIHETTLCAHLVCQHFAHLQVLHLWFAQHLSALTLSTMATLPPLSYLSLDIGSCAKVPLMPLGSTTLELGLGLAMSSILELRLRMRHLSDVTARQLATLSNLTVLELGDDFAAADTSSPADTSSVTRGAQERVPYCACTLGAGAAHNFQAAVSTGAVEQEAVAANVDVNAHSNTHAHTNILSQTSLTDCGLGWLARLQGLRDLRLTHFHHISDAGLQSLQQLHALSVCRCIGVRGTTLPRLRNLRRLCIDVGGRSAISEQYWKQLDQLPRLETLLLCNFHQFNPTLTQVMSKHFSLTRRISVMTDDDV